ncbi:hypothetical protein [Kitasatospora herbaricolor]|uniref:YcaO domain-containing protein n=1 Tax=Kitasatospora herbaricolor TaxID=68217 RepID=A0ABZ1WAW1_9ACTN|nr:hypothetical protein [Kitasatospora herbaricolor]
MSALRRMNAYTIDYEGRTYGLAEAGPLELSTGLSGWIRLVSSWVEQGRDVEQAADELGGARAAQARRVRDAMVSVGILRQPAVPGEVRFTGESAELEGAVECSGLTLPAVVLGAGPLRGDWLEGIRAAPGVGRAGAVLFAEGAAVVVGPMDAEQLYEVVAALRCGDLADGRPHPTAARTAAAQLVRRVALGSADVWSGLTVTREETTSWRALPHPWRPASPGRVAEPFDERVMAVIDPVHGVVREIGEDDLPQVPRHLARARVVGRASIRPLDVEVVADGSDYGQARRRVVLAALAVHLESTLDPRAVVDAAGRPVLDATDDLSALRAATDRIAAAPGSHFLRARRLADDSPVLVPVGRARCCEPGAGPALGTAAAEGRDDALTTALLDLLETWAVDAPGPVVRVHDNEGLPAEAREALDHLLVSDRQAWLGVLPEETVPTAVATTRHGTLYGRGTSHAAAAVRAMEQAVLTDQVLMHGRADLAPRTLGRALPLPDRVADLPGSPSITLMDLREAVAQRAPGTTVVDLDHDPGVVRLGISAVKVVVD